MNVDFPFHFDGRGHTAQTGEDDHLRNLIEQVLFTSPGERLNRPTFGSGLLRLVFDPAGEAIAAAAQFAVQAALQQWLGELIEPREITVEVEEATVRVVVRFVVRSTQEPRVEQFTQVRP